MSLSISLSTDGNDIFIKLSRELEEGEIPCLLRRGSARLHKKDEYGNRIKRRNKWSVYYHKGDKFSIEVGTNRFLGNNRLWKWYQMLNIYAKIRKASYSKYYIPLEEGRTRKVCFGIGIYKDFGKGRLKRVSNICYFRSNVRATSDSTFEQWLSV